MLNVPSFNNIIEYFKNPPCHKIKKKDIKWKKMNKKKLINLLVTKNGFDYERMNKRLEHYKEISINLNNNITNKDIKTFFNNGFKKKKISDD